jgi:hypothetical protein
MAYLGNRPILGAFSKLDTIAGSFNGSATSFPLTIGAVPVAGGVATNILVSLNGVMQEPVVDYNISGTNIVFTVAPPISSSFFGVKLGDLGMVAIPNDLSVSASKLDAGLTATIAAKEVTTNKNASGGYVGLNLYKINLPNNANTFTSLLQNTNTAVRTYTTQDKDGTIAHTSDVVDSSAKTVPVDADVFGVYDSAASFAVKKSSWANIKATYTATANAYTRQQYFTEATLTYAASQNWDVSVAQVARVTLTGNVTFAAPTNQVAGAFYSLAVIQDGTGSRTGTWNSVFKFTNGSAPTLSTAANARDYFTFRSDGTNLYEQGRSQGVA